MIISHKYKFIFIKTVKTAGTSIEIFLSQHCGPKDILTPIRPHVEPHQPRNYYGFWNPLPEIMENRGQQLFQSISTALGRNKFSGHTPAVVVKQRISPKIWNSYHKFCVDRNPWDKTLSHYHMVKDRNGGDLTLDTYLQKKNFCFNYHRYCDASGKLLVDQVIPYESLMDGLGKLFSDKGIPFAGSLGVRAKSNHREDRRPYQEVFTPKQLDLITSAFDKEIKMHGYHFDPL